jgi:predicted RNA-binding Zn ribbon-like protein
MVTMAVDDTATQVFEFISDRPALDFVATVAERGTTDLDQLQTTTDLAAWVRESGLVKDRLTIGDDDLGRAKTVREAMFRLIAALIDSTTPAAADRRLVNRTAERPRPVSQLSPAGHVNRTGDLDAVFAVLAQDCIELFDGPDRELVSWCANPRCTRPFIDRSRGHRRRWCDMKGCGDRAKAATYRHRRRSAAGVDARASAARNGS